jgi:hypothetical protein
MIAEWMSDQIPASPLVFRHLQAYQTLTPTMSKV